MNETEQLRRAAQEDIAKMAQDTAWQALSRTWMEESIDRRYSYHFEWMGRPCIQYPQDMMAMQELIWKVKPDLIVETGIAHGGSLVFYASMLELLGQDGEAVGVEQHIFPQVRADLEAHPMAKRITMIEGDSVSDEVARKVSQLAANKSRVLVALDSCHTHEHVMAELERFSPLVKKGSYIVVFDTIVNEMTEEQCANRPWSPAANPKTAVYEFLSKNKRFEIDSSIADKLQITVCHDGYLKCIADEPSAE